MELTYYKSDALFFNSAGIISKLYTVLMLRKRDISVFKKLAFAFGEREPLEHVIY